MGFNNKRIIQLVKLSNKGAHYDSLHELSGHSLDVIYNAIQRYPSMMGNFYEVVLQLHYFFRLHHHSGTMVTIDRGDRKAPTQLLTLPQITGGTNAGGAVDLTHIDFDGLSVIGFTMKYKKSPTLSLGDLEFLAVKATIDRTFHKTQNKYYGIVIRDRNQISHLYKTGELDDSVVVYDFIDMVRFWKEIQIYISHETKTLYEIERNLASHQKVQITLREEQYVGASAAVDYFENRGDEFLLHAKMRYGKIVTSYEIARRLKCKTVLMATFFPAVNKSWEEDAEFKNYENIRIVNTAELHGKKIDITPRTDDEIVIVLTSYQDFKGMKQKAKWTHLRKHSWDLLISDEFHYGVESEQTTKLLSETNYKKHLALSGTPIKALLRGRFGLENTYTWTYIDEQRAKRSGLTAYKWLPTMNIHMLNVPPQVQEDLCVYDNDESFTLNKLFATHDGVFLHEDSVIMFLDMVSGEHGYKKSLSPYHYGNTRSAGLRHTVWYLPDVNSTIALESIMRTHPYFKKYKVLTINSSKYNAKDVLHVVRHHCVSSEEENFRGSITLAFKQLNTGSSVPKWSGVFMLNGTKSIETYLQTIFRAQSQNRRDGKLECHVFDFNPSRCLQILYEFAATTNKTNPMEELSEWLEFAPLISHDSNSITTLNTNEFMEMFAFLGSHSRVFGHESSINVSNLTNELEEQIYNIFPSTTTIEMNDIPSNELVLGKNKTIDREPSQTLSPNELEKIRGENIQRLKTITRSIPWLLLFTNNKHTSVSSAIKSLNKSTTVAYEERLGVSVQCLNDLITSKTINISYLNLQTISFNHACMKNKKAVMNNLVMDSTSDQNIKQYGEVATPPDVIIDMLNTLPQSLWSDPTTQWLDPVCCSGGFLIQIFKNLMSGLTDIFPDENKRAKHILGTMIYGIDIRSSSVLLTKLRLKFGRITAKNIICGDSLQHTPGKKFDVVVGNPPYQDGKFKSFAAMAIDSIKVDGHMLYIAPPACMIPGKTSLLNDILFKYTLHHIEVNTVKYNPMVHWKFTWFYIQKTIPTNIIKTTYKTNFDKQLYFGEAVLNDRLNFIPSLISTESLHILNKVVGDDDLPKMCVLSTREHRFNKLNKKLSGKQDDKYIYPYAHTSANNWEIRCWSTHPHQYQYDKKVLISDVGYPRIIYDDGILGMTYHTYCVLVKNKTQGYNLIHILNSKLYTFIQRISNVSYNRMQSIYFYQMLPSMHLTKKWSDVEIYALFGLNANEIRLIERVG